MRIPGRYQKTESKTLREIGHDLMTKGDLSRTRTTLDGKRIGLDSAIGAGLVLLGAIIQLVGIANDAATVGYEKLVSKARDKVNGIER